MTEDDNERAYIADAMRHGAGMLTKLGNKTSISADRYSDERAETLNRVARHYYRAADAIRDAAAAFVTDGGEAAPR